MSYKSVPAVPPAGPQLGAMLQALKENVDGLTGTAPDRPSIAQLASTATLADVINTLNQVVRRLT